MSVDYRAGIAKGYIVTAEQMRAAAEAHDMGVADLTEILCDEHDMLIYLNTWAADGDYIIGFDVAACEEGGAAYIDELSPGSANRLNQLILLYSKYFGAPATNPRFITYLSVT